MYLIVFVALVLQTLFCESYTQYSAISCAIGRKLVHDESTINKERIYSFINKNHVRSIEENIKFNFYSREHPEGVEFIFSDENSLSECNFDPKRPTKIITHGFNGKGHDNSCLSPTKAWLQTGDFNIFVMDWYDHQCEGQLFPIYWEVVKKLKDVGLHLAELISFLEKHGMDPNTLSLVGHSLGAHVVGIAGYNTKSKVNYIVGLDPAEPMILENEPGERISDQDANHVEIIHTNGHHCGMFKKLGHYDFYVNGGVKQPGCKNHQCSHSRAHEYYAESIHSLSKFYGKSCSDINNIDKEKCDGNIGIMGGTSRDYISPGIYYVETNSQYPYAIGSYRNTKNF